MVAYRSVSGTTGTAGTTLSVTKPTGTISGDCLVAMQRATTLAEMTTPTGGSTWLPLDTETSNAVTPMAAKLWIKTAGGSEPASYTFNKTSGAGTQVIIVCVENGGSDTAVFASLNTGTGSDANTPGVDPTGTADVEIRFVMGITGV